MRPQKAGERRDAAITLVVEQARRHSHAGVLEPDDPGLQRSAARLQRLSDLHSDVRSFSSQLAKVHRRG